MNQKLCLKDWRTFFKEFNDSLPMKYDVPTTIALVEQFYKHMEKPKQGLPLILNIKNNGDKPETAVVYGWIQNWAKPNCGSPSSITITPEPDSISYHAQLADIALNPFQMRSIIIQSEHPEQKYGWLGDLVINEGNGRCSTHPLEFKEYDKEDAPLRAVGVCDFPKAELNGQTAIHLKVLPQSELTLQINPRILPRHTPKHS